MKSPTDLFDEKFFELEEEYPNLIKEIKDFISTHYNLKSESILKDEVERVYKELDQYTSGTVYNQGWRHALKDFRERLLNNK